MTRRVDILRNIFEKMAKKIKMKSQEHLGEFQQRMSKLFDMDSSISLFINVP